MAENPAWSKGKKTAAQKIGQALANYRHSSSRNNRAEASHQQGRTGIVLG